MNKFKQQFLAGPYLIWIIGFIVLPMVMILYYAFTNSDGGFTFRIYRSNYLCDQPQRHRTFPETWNHLHSHLSGALLSTGNDTEQYAN